MARGQANVENKVLPNNEDTLYYLANSKPKEKPKPKPKKEVPKSE